MQHVMLQRNQNGKRKRISFKNQAALETPSNMLNGCFLTVNVPVYEERLPHNSLSTLLL